MTNLQQKKKHLVVFGEDFNGLPSSTQHLVKLLANERKVLWVNSIGLRQPKFNFTDCQRVVNKIGQYLFKPKKCKKVSPFAKQNASHDNIHVMSAMTIPAPQSKGAREVARFLLTKQVNKAIKKFLPQGEAYDLWISLPTAADLIGHLGEDKVIYYCGDDFSSLAGVDHETVTRREQKLIAKADLILAASYTLKTKFPEAKSHWVEHGVDLSLFNDPKPMAQELKDITQNNALPSAGFYGSISEWLDQDLVVETAKLLPHWQFIFIGHIHTDVDKLKAQKNIHFVEAQAHQDLPGFSQHWTASLMPFRLNGQIKACNPLKLTEYLAAGQPVIATPFNAVKQYQGFVQTISTAKEMAETLEASKAQQSEEMKQGLRKAVSNKSWISKSQQVEKLLEAI
ncbi:glycosyltransferase [Catenovulum sp. SM1970]|uniref:glycosyltransferase n=1 Tax=Marinifaba aquimaris TaxID=2741323 RepID=UPI0015739718|nr:glycosyltransferase [Marinifaba aquimaris]NTS76158.1 glycosyltransferase [Marinifaba aquimaris]